MTYTMYTAVIIQVYTCHDRARLQNGSRSLDKVDATRLLHSQRHHHLHHLTRQHEQTVNKKKKHRKEKRAFRDQLSEHSPQSLHTSLLHRRDRRPRLCTAAVCQQRATSAPWDPSPSQTHKSCCQRLCGSCGDEVIQKELVNTNKPDSSRCADSRALACLSPPSCRWCGCCRRRTAGGRHRSACGRLSRCLSRSSWWHRSLGIGEPPAGGSRDYLLIRKCNRVSQTLNTEGSEADTLRQYLTPSYIRSTVTELRRLAAGSTWPLEMQEMVFISQWLQYGYIYMTFNLLLLSIKMWASLLHLYPGLINCYLGKAQSWPLKADRHIFHCNKLH